MSLEKSFRYESLNYTNSDGECNQLEVTIDIICTNKYDYSFEIESIEDLDTNTTYKLSDLPLDDQSKIEELADKLAYEHAHEAYEEYQQYIGDCLYDQWKDRQLEDKD